MDYFSSPVELKAAIYRTLARNGAELSEPVLDAIGTALASASPVVGIVDTMEAVYSARDGLSEPWLIVGGQCAQMVEASDFHQKGERASTLHQVFRRCLGERKTPDPKHDPEPEPRFIPPAEEATGE